MSNYFLEWAMTEFQNRLKEFMDDKELSNLQLSKMLGISSSAVDAYFCKDLYPEMKTAIKLCKMFDCSMDYLFGLSDENEPKYDFEKVDIRGNFVANVEKLLERKNMSKAKFAKQVGMSEHTFYRWKNGEFPRTVSIVNVAKYLDISIDFLLADKLN